jgi:hypothetical protein
MKVWISRDGNEGVADMFEVHGEKPTRYDYGYSSADKLADLRTGFVSQFLGFTPHKGSCKQYNLTLEEVK